MYTYVETIIDSLSQRLLTRESKPLQKINDLIKPQTRVYFLLKHTATGDTEYLLSISDIQSETLYDVDLTISQFLINNANNTLPTVENFYKSTGGQVKVKDIFQAGYSVNYASSEAGLTTDLPDIYLKDISFTKPSITDYSLLSDYCLLTVNGLLHRIESSETAAYGIGAGRSCQVANDHQISLISFKDVGKIKTIPITKTMLSSDKDINGFCNKTYITVDEDLSNKTILLSIGGYLQYLDASYRLTSDKTICVYPSKLSLEQRLLQSDKLMDLKEIKDSYFTKPTNTTAFLAMENLSDDIIKTYFTLEQSFIIVLDVPYIKVNFWQAEYTRLAGRYYCYRPPQDLLIGEYGLIVPYISVLESGKYVIYTQSSLRREYIFSDLPYKQELSYDDAKESQRPVKELAPLFLKMFT